MAVSGFLYVDGPVSTLQFDVDTEGELTSAIDPAAAKLFQSNRLSATRLRVVIFGLNVTTFVGKIAEAPKPVLGILNVVGANPDASAAAVNVKYLGAPSNLQAQVQVRP